MAFALIAAMAFAMPAAATLDLPPECPGHSYLGNDPDGTDLPDWSENAQGIANDGEHWFFTNRDGGLYKYAANWSPVDGDDVGRLATAGFPPVLASLGIDHFGDPDYYAGYVFVPFEKTDGTRAVIAAFRASDLAFVDWVDVYPFQPKAGWVAIDPVDRVLYTSTDRITEGTPLLRYQLHLDKLENGVVGDFLTPTTPVDLLDFTGAPLTGELHFMQGGVFTPWGDLYLSVGHADAGDNDPGERAGGIYLFRRNAAGTAFEYIINSTNVSDHVGDSVFAYEYHPGDTGYGEEPEGIDWWNRDNMPGSVYHGQLHAILLDNSLFDDPVWLKHYRVDYFCVGDADSDGDGISDWAEVYLYGTNPLAVDVAIDFEGFAGMANIAGAVVPASSRVSDEFLATDGVVFSSGASFAAAVALGANHATSGTIGIGGVSAAGTLSYGEPIDAEFFVPGIASESGVTDFVSVRGDLKGVGGLVTLQAFDIDGVALAMDSEVDQAGPELHVSAVGIHSVEFFSATANVAFDDFSFGAVRPVPEPTNGVCLGTAMLWLIGISRWRDRAIR